MMTNVSLATFLLNICSKLENVHNYGQALQHLKDHAIFNLILSPIIIPTFFYNILNIFCSKQNNFFNPYLFFIENILYAISNFKYTKC